MMRISLAFWTFFRVLFNKPFSQKVETLYLQEAKLLEAPPPEQKPQAAPKAAAQTSRSDALVLLALMQREGRLIDFLKEPLEPYSDAQIGAAVRDIHRDCRAVLDKVFDVKPILTDPEGGPITVADGFDAEQYRLTGNVTGTPPYSGTLRHHGWIADKCDLPQWQGSESAAKIIAPAEVEVA